MNQHDFLLGSIAGRTHDDSRQLRQACLKCVAAYALRSVELFSRSIQPFAAAAILPLQYRQKGEWQGCHQSRGPRCRTESWPVLVPGGFTELSTGGAIVKKSRGQADERLA